LGVATSLEWRCLDSLDAVFMHEPANVAREATMNLSAPLGVRRRITQLGLIVVVAIASMGQSCPGPLPCPSGTTCAEPSHTLESASIDTEGCDLNPGGLGGDNLTEPIGEVLAGWDYNTRGNALGARGVCDKAQYNYRGGVLFNATFIADFVSEHGLLEAYLVFEVPSSRVFPSGPYVAAPYGCLGHVGVATVDWTGESPSDYQLIPYDDLVDLPIHVTPPYDSPPVHLVGIGTTYIWQIDVTSQIRRWAIDPESNNGFVLVGQNESGEPDNGACVSRINNFQLRLVPLR
jgi:hypothetical protein